MKLVIEIPGSLTTVQDLGRWGYQAIGMPVSGAMDAPALIRGNILLGNPDGAAALEMTMTGATVKFKDGEGAIAVTGGDLQPKINNNPVKKNIPIQLKTNPIKKIFKKISPLCHTIQKFLRLIWQKNNTNTNPK